MSSAPQARPSPEDYYNGVVRRMVGLPRTLLGGFSRAMGLTGGGGRGSQPHQLQPPPQHHHGQPAVAYPYYPPQAMPSMVQDQWAFLSTYETSYGQAHPFFYACSFTEALRLAREEGKLLFVYLHHPDHANPFTASFCRNTLSSEVVIQFVDANFVSWGGLPDRGQGLQMAHTLRPSSFPFCALIAPARRRDDDNITVLQQIEGPVSPAELVEILQRTMDNHGVAFGSLRTKEEEKRRADRRLREEQDAAYLAALKLDQEKEKAKNKPTTDAGQTSKVNKESVMRPSSVKARNNSKVTQILVRFPNGERLEQSFSVSDKMQAIFRYVDSLGVPGVGKYILVSSFPRKTYGADQMNMSFEEAGLYPKATLFLETIT